MKPEDGRADGHYSPEQFLKCPECHRSGTVSITVHIDGDSSIECSACGAFAAVNKLHSQDRTYE